jgi:hypothetical protein
MLDTEQGPHMRVGAEAGDSCVRAEGAGRATRPYDAGTENEGGAGNREMHDTIQAWRASECVRASRRPNDGISQKENGSGRYAYAPVQV